MIVYKIEAGKGSEDGSGYAYGKACAAHFNDLTIYTRVNNAVKLASDPHFKNTTVVGIDVPRWISFWKKGRRGVIPYYYMWQLCVGRRVATDHASRRYDVIHQFNFHADWAPHFLPSNGTRVIWGPLAHQPVVPMQFVETAKLKFFLKERLKRSVRLMFWYLDPALRRCARQSDVIVSVNTDLAPPIAKAKELGVRVLVGGFGGAAETLLQARDARKEPVTQDGFVVLHVGRFSPIKGQLLALRAFARFKENKPLNSCHLVMVGGTVEELRLGERTEKIGHGDGVTFVRYVNQSILADYYATSTCLLYPSLGNHDIVVPEALAFGLPIIGFFGYSTETVAGEAFLGASIGSTADSTELSLVFALNRLYESFISDKRLVNDLSDAALARSERVSWRAMSESYIELIHDPINATELPP